MGYDGVVAGTGVPQLPGAVLQRPTAAALVQPAAAGAAARTSAVTAGQSEAPRAQSPTPRLRGTVRPTAPAVSAGPTPSYIDNNNNKQYSEALQVDNSSVIGNPVSAKKVIFVSDSANHHVDNKTETETVNGKQSSTASGSAGASPGPG